jgi:hypothetical protein
VALVMTLIERSGKRCAVLMAKLNPAIPDPITRKSVRDMKKN